MSMNREIASFIYLLQDIVDYWEVKWTKEQNDRLYFEGKILSLKNKIREIKNTAPEENVDIINDLINYWAEGWAREQAENIRFEERLRFEQDQAEEE